MPEDRKPSIPLESGGANRLWTGRRALLLILAIVVFVVIFSKFASQKTPPISEYQRDHPVQPANPQQLESFGRSIESAPQLPKTPQGMTEEEFQRRLAEANAKGDRDGAAWQQQNGAEEAAAEERRKKAEAALAASNVVVSFRAPPQSALAQQAAQETPVTRNDRAERPEQAKPAEYDFNSSNGKLYRVFEGTLLPCTLANRLNGSFAGPLTCIVSENILSHDHEAVLIPQGSILVGDVSEVNNVNQERLMVAFHRIIMPDGYSWDLKKFPGLDQTGATALKDKTNHHYVPAFGAGLAIGGIGGLAQIRNGYSGFGYDPGVAIRSGFSSEMSQESMQILQRYLTRLPTFVIREGQRVRVFVLKDMLLPAYANHDMDPHL